jgi:hypothetical protein
VGQLAWGASAWLWGALVNLFFLLEISNSFIFYASFGWLVAGADLL